MESKKNIWKKWLYWFGFAIAIIMVYKTLDNFKEITDWAKGILNVLMPFIMGIFLAYLFYIPCTKFEKWYGKSKTKWIRKKGRTLSVFTTYLLAVILLIIAINFIFPTIKNSVTDLVNNIGNYYNDTIQNLDELEEDSILKKLDLQKIIEGIKQIKLEQYLNFEMLTEYAKSALGVANGIFDFFVSIIVSIYILLERDSILAFMKKITKVLVKPKTSKLMEKYFSMMNEVFFKFLSSQLLDAGVVGVLTSTAMVLLGVKYAVLLGMLIGLSNLIPYFGAILGVGFTILITLITGGVSQAFWVAVVVIILQQIDANIINPKIVGNSLQISPLLVIFAVTIGGAYFGMLGMFLAVPVFTVLKILVEDYLEYRGKQRELEEENRIS